MTDQTVLDDNRPPTWRTIAKAIAGAATAGFAAAGAALVDQVVDPVEWTVIAVAIISGLAVVWAVPNAPTTDPEQTDNPEPPSTGGKVITIEKDR